MFDIGWQEIFLIGLITILVVGPKELPRVLRTCVTTLEKMRGFASDFQRSIYELARESELEEIKNDIESTGVTDFDREIENIVDPTGQISDTMQQLENELASTGQEIDTISNQKEEVLGEVGKKTANLRN